MTDTPPPRRPWLTKARLDLVLAISAIFISAMSLLVAIRTEQSQRETLAASVWPFLQRNISTGSTTDPEMEMSFGISNDGVGPAKVRSVEVFYAGKPMQSADEFLRKCCGFRDDVPRAQQLRGGYSISVADNTVQRAGEQNLMIRLKPAAVSPEFATRFRAALRELTFRGCYCSVRDECWTSDLASTETEAVAACPAPQFPFNPVGK